MKIFNVALNEGVDYDQFWYEIETDGVGGSHIPVRAVGIVNERPTSLRQCWYELSDEEANILKNDPRVYCVEIPPEFRTDIEITPLTTQTGLYYKLAGVNPSNNNGVNWGLPRIASRTNNTPGLQGDFSYHYDITGEGVDFVIQDTGLQVDHPEFTDQLGVTRVQQINWFTASGITGIMPTYFYTDTVGHGTHCAGIAAGKTYGRAKNSKIYVMAVEGLSDYGISVTNAFDCIKGWHLNKPINPATGYRRPTVVNMSWGYINNWTYLSITSITYQGIKYPASGPNPTYGMVGRNGYWPVRVDSVDVDVAELLAAGVILVGAAGNYQQTIDVPTGRNYNNYFTAGLFNNIYYYMRGMSPTAANGVICVGNVDSAYDNPERKATTSESGPRVDIWAPGTNIVSAVSTTNEFGATTPYPGNSSFRICSISGTSMASPQVAGLACQILEQNPNFTPDNVKQRVIQLSTPNMLYTTGLVDDYSDLQSLHGAPNRFAYIPASLTANLTISGSLDIMSGIGLSFV